MPFLSSYLTASCSESSPDAPRVDSRRFVAEPCNNTIHEDPRNEQPHRIQIPRKYSVVFAGFKCEAQTLRTHWRKLKYAHPENAAQSYVRYRPPKTLKDGVHLDDISVFSRESWPSFSADGTSLIAFLLYQTVGIPASAVMLNATLPGTPPPSTCDERTEYPDRYRVGRAAALCGGGAGKRSSTSRRLGGTSA